MVVDMHSHVLPAVDDGSASVEESLAMLRLTARQGIDSIVATPHFYADRDDPDRFLKNRAEAWKTLQQGMGQDSQFPQVKLGAEVYFYPGMSHSDILKRLTIDAKRCILIEMPHAPWTDRMYRELAEIRERQGLIPVIAHVDRYIGPLRTYGIPQKLEQLPVLVQANASFFLNRATSGMALRMLKRNQIQLLGSDCHNMQNRPPRLGEAIALIRSRLGDAAVEQLEEYQQYVFSG